jgi:N-acetylmuramoyl-L-alanine amidase
MHTKNRLIGLWLLLVLPVLLGANEYYTVTIEKGENLTNLLKRYNLSVGNCNQALFLQINSLSDASRLLADKKYFLPIKIYKFNGINIRTSIGIKDYELAKRIEEYNEIILKKGIRKTHYKTSKLLWVPDEFLSCNNMDVEPKVVTSSSDTFTTISKEKTVNDEKPAFTSTESGKSSFKNSGLKKIKVPLMGKDFEDVWIEDYSLKDNVYYIISGHGGPDPGAVYKKDGVMYCEDEYAYDVALRLARNLMQHGAVVHMIVQDDNGIRDQKVLECDCTETMHNDAKIPRSQKERLRQRAFMVNSLYEKYRKQGYKTQKAIEIHVDSRNESKRQDVFFYYNKHDKNGKTLAENVHGVFEKKYSVHQKNRGYHGYVEDRDIYMVRNLRPTTLFIELANIRNPKDQERLIYYYNRQALANWLFEGLK